MTYDDRNLQRLYAAMTPKQRGYALRFALRKAANTVRDVARRNLHATGIHNGKKLGRGIRTQIGKKVVGFTVHIKKAYYASTNAKKKAEKTGKKVRKVPILRWWEEGTAGRHSVRRRMGKPSISVRHGRLERHGFMDKTFKQTRGPVTDFFHKELIDSVKKTARKYGCV